MVPKNRESVVQPVFVPSVVVQQHVIFYKPQQIPFKSVGGHHQVCCTGYATCGCKGEREQKTGLDLSRRLFHNSSCNIRNPEK